MTTGIWINQGYTAGISALTVVLIAAKDHAAGELNSGRDCSFHGPLQPECLQQSPLGRVYGVAMKRATLPGPENTRLQGQSDSGLEKGLVRWTSLPTKNHTTMQWKRHNPPPKDPKSAISIFIVFRNPSR